MHIVVVINYNHVLKCGSESHMIIVLGADPIFLALSLLVT